MTVTRKPGRYALVLGAALMFGSFLVTGVQAATGSVAGGESAAHHAAVSSAPRALVGWRPSDRVPMPRAVLASPQVTNSFSSLFSVYCTSANKCWAVGEQAHGIGISNLVLRWNGSSWHMFNAPNPGGTGEANLTALFAVRCVSARDCWAVGEYGKELGFGAVFGLALHWNGTKWSRVATPSPGGRKKGDESELFDVTCASATNCWAVGDFGFLANNKPEKFRNFALHWNGSKWSRFNTPNPGGLGSTHVNSLFSVRCGSSTSCDAVGDFGRETSSTTTLHNQALHWNGSKWTLKKTPNPGGTSPTDVNELNMLGCTSATNCWGVGAYGTQLSLSQTSKDEIFHWNGRKWSRAQAPHPGGVINNLFGVMCGLPKDCWGVGDYEINGDGLQNQAAHWNGSKWILFPTPNPAGTMSGVENELYSVRCTSRKNCWAVGVTQFQGELAMYEILHWNGSKWSIRLPQLG
jgi:hypothetical protein